MIYLRQSRNPCHYIGFNVYFRHIWRCLSICLWVRILTRVSFLHVTSVCEVSGWGFHSIVLREPVSWPRLVKSHTTQACLPKTCHPWHSHSDSARTCSTWIFVAYCNRPTSRNIDILRFSVLLGLQLWLTASDEKTHWPPALLKLDCERSKPCFWWTRFALAVCLPDALAVATPVFHCGTLRSTLLRCLLGKVSLTFLASLLVPLQVS